MMDLVVVGNDHGDELRRSLTLTNEQFAVLAMCVESYSETYRAKHSQVVATYVTRGQLDEAVIEAKRMNELLRTLDLLQVAVMS